MLLWRCFKYRIKQGISSEIDEEMTPSQINPEKIVVLPKGVKPVTLQVLVGVQTTEVHVWGTCGEQGHDYTVYVQVEMWHAYESED